MLMIHIIATVIASIGGVGAGGYLEVGSAKVVVVVVVVRGVEQNQQMTKRDSPAEDATLDAFANAAH
jgi:hypothetical protein